MKLPSATPRLEDTRFWSKVDSTGECWTWTSVQRRGYGRFWLNGRYEEAHRIAFGLINGAIPEGLTLDHLCRNRSCVNPAHLEPVTMRENLMRGASPSAVNAQKTHCLRGHPFDGSNLIIRKRRDRDCVQCSRQREKAAYERRRAVPR
jgi:hypothetical protein